MSSEQTLAFLTFYILESPCLYWTCWFLSYWKENLCCVAQCHVAEAKSDHSSSWSLEPSNAGQDCINKYPGLWLCVSVCRGGCGGWRTIMVFFLTCCPSLLETGLLSGLELTR